MKPPCGATKAEAWHGHEASPDTDYTWKKQQCQPPLKQPSSLSYDAQCQPPPSPGLIYFAHRPWVLLSRIHPLSSNHHLLPTFPTPPQLLPLLPTTTHHTHYTHTHLSSYNLPHSHTLSTILRHSTSCHQFSPQCPPSSCHKISQSCLPLPSNQRQHPLS